MFILLLESAVHNLRTSKFAFLCKAKTLFIKYCASENIANSTHLLEIVVILRKEISELKQQKQEEQEIKNQLRKCKGFNPSSKLMNSLVATLSLLTA